MHEWFSFANKFCTFSQKDEVNEIKSQTKVSAITACRNLELNQHWGPLTIWFAHFSLSWCLLQTFLHFCRKSKWIPKLNVTKAKNSFGAGNGVQEVKICQSLAWNRKGENCSWLRTGLKQIWSQSSPIRTGTIRSELVLQDMRHRKHRPSTSLCLFLLFTPVVMPPYKN